MTRSARQILTTPGKGHMTLLTSFRRDAQESVPWLLPWP